MLHDVRQCQECFHHLEHRLTWRLVTLHKIMLHIQLGNPSKKMKNIARFLMSSISFHLKFDISLEVKLRKNWGIPKFSTITNNSLNLVWCHYGINGMEGGNLNFMILWKYQFLTIEDVGILIFVHPSMNINVL